jgi:hypothetical protein
MKLFFCPECHDIVKMVIGEMRYCSCKKSGGMYVDNVVAEIEGKAVPLGIDNNELVAAYQLKSGKVPCKFSMFFIPDFPANHIIHQPLCYHCRNNSTDALNAINHPINCKDRENGSQGYQVYRCHMCGEYWGCRYQYDRESGSDNRWAALGKDPEKIRRHY